MEKSKFLDMLQINTVDAGNGTLFGVPDKRAVNKQNLTLVISTGGSGKSAIQAAIKTANQRMKEEYSTYVKFLVVDSATNELSVLNRQGIDTLNISSPGAADRLSEQNRSTFYKKFIPKDFPANVIDSEGAAQQRMIGKVKLFDTNGGNTNDQALRDKIAGYFAGDWSDKAGMTVDIMILTGISGGNGSGTFMDIAAIAKSACPNPGNVNVYGYIMLPDTVADYASNAAAKDSLYRNGFAALKELESYMSIGMENGRRENFASTVAANDVVISDTNKLFDYPVLISGRYDDAVSVIAETIVNAAADSNGGFNQKSFYSNLETQRNVALSSVSEAGILKNNAAPEDSHYYCGIGYANASIPEKVVIPHVIGVVNQKLYVPQTGEGLEAKEATAFCTRERALNKLEFQKAMRQMLGLPANMELKTDTLWKKVYSQLVNVCKLRDNPNEITYNEITAGQFGQYMNAFGSEAAGNRAAEAMQKFVKDEYNAIITRAQKVMEQYGPRAIEYLYSGAGNFDEQGKKEDFSTIGLKSQMEYIKDQFLNVSNMPIKKPQPLEAAGFLHRVIHTEEVAEWKANAKAGEESNVRRKVAGFMAGSSGVWKKDFMDRIDDFKSKTQRFADVLETISEYYAGVGKSLDSNTYNEFAQYSGEANGINLCRDSDMYNWVITRVNQKINGIDINQVRQELIQDFYSNTDKWISENPGEARTAFDEIMSRVSAVGKYAGKTGGMSLSIGDYFTKILEDVPDAQQQTVIQNTINTIYSNLEGKSTPSLKLRPGVPVFKNQTIMLPQSLGAGTYGPMIKQAFENAISAGSGNHSVVFSSVVDSIVCYQTSVANALSDLSDLTLWEDAYDNAFMNTTHLNNGEYVQLHEKTGFSQYKELTMQDMDREMGMKRTVDSSVNTLYGTGLSWRNYPSINIDRYSDSFDGKTVDQKSSGTSESKYRRDIFAKKVDEALRVGIIECEKENNVYKYFLNVIPGDWTAFRLRGYNVKQNGRYVRGKELFEYLAGQNTHSDAVYRKQIALNGSPFFGTNGFDFNEIVSLKHWDKAVVEKTAKAYMMRVLRKSTSLYQEMEDTLWRYYDIEKELAEKEADALRTIGFKNFLEWYLNGVVNTDEDQTEWTVLTNSKGDVEDLIMFGRRTVGRMEPWQKSILKDGFRLKLVYDAFADCREELELTDDLLNDVKEDLADQLGDKKLDQMVDARLEVLQNEMDTYKSKYGKSKDELGAIMDAYGVDDDLMNEMQEVVDFFSAVGDVIEEQNSLF